MSSIPILSQTKISDLLPANKQIISLEASIKVPEAMQLMAQHNISSAPVKAPGAKDEFLGFVDFVDIVSFIVSIVHSEKPELHGQHLMKMLFQEKLFHDQHIGAIVDLSKRNTFWPVKKDLSLLEAMKIFAKTGAHRLPIVDENKHIVNILSLTDVVGFLTKHSANLGALSSKTIRELGISNTNVISVKIDEPAIVAFQKMSQNRISAVALLEHDGTILSNISAKDIKIVMKDMLLPKLFETSREFAADVRQANLFSFAAHVTVHEGDTFQQTLGKLGATRMHRVYVTENDRPLGVISLIDICRAVLDADAQDNGKF